LSVSDFFGLKNIHACRVVESFQIKRKVYFVDTNSIPGCAMQNPFRQSYKCKVLRTLANGTHAICTVIYENSLKMFLLCYLHKLGNTQGSGLTYVAKHPLGLFD
jgi:hypothetical protein